MAGRPGRASARIARARRSTWAPLTHEQSRSERWEEDLGRALGLSAAIRYPLPNIHIQDIIGHKCNYTYIYIYIIYEIELNSTSEFWEESKRNTAHSTYRDQVSH